VSTAVEREGCSPEVPVVKSGSEERGESMIMIKIRDLRGSLIEKLSDAQELVGITNNKVLAAVMVPVTRGWVEHVIENNWSRVAQSIAEGQHERDAGRPLVSLDAALAAADASSEPDHEAGQPLIETIPGIPLVRRLFQVLAHHEDDPASVSPVRVVRIGDMSGAVLGEAREADQIIAVTNERVVVAFLLPVTNRLVDHLIETNKTRVMYNVSRGQSERTSGKPLTTLGHALTLTPKDVQTLGEEVVQRSEEAQRRAVDQ
jgi:hypothetical protein